MTRHLIGRRVRAVTYIKRAGRAGYAGSWREGKGIDGQVAGYDPQTRRYLVRGRSFIVVDGETYYGNEGSGYFRSDQITLTDDTEISH